MAKIRLYGETSGYVELAAPSVANDSTLDISLVPTVDTAPSDGQVLTWNASASKWEPKDLVMTQKKIAAFTASGTWTVPAGVTYAIAHMRGGGGGSGESNTASNGSASSVAFAGGTVSAEGGLSGDTQSTALIWGQAGPANSGHPGGYTSTTYVPVAFPASEIVAGDDVTPGASITVTVGAGGAAGTAGNAGGSGYVYIEYYEAV